MCSFKHISVALLLLSLVACSGTAPRDLKPWEKTSGSATSQHTSSDMGSARPDYGPKLAVGKPYTVKRGDTLYAIAFRLGLDFRELAARNGIRAPYTINVGQVLQTSKPIASTSNKSSKTSDSGKSTTTAPLRLKPKPRWLNQSLPLGRRLSRQPRPLKQPRKLSPPRNRLRKNRSSPIVPCLDGGGRLAGRWSEPSPLTSTKGLISQVAEAIQSPQLLQVRSFMQGRASQVTARSSL